MKEFKRWIFCMMLLLILTGCAKAEEKPLKVYSFSGENEQIAVSNSVIVLRDTEEIFYGGDLEAVGEEFSDITCYSTKFYIMSGSEKTTISSNMIENLTGGTVQVPGGLGKLSGDGIITSTKIKDVDDLKNNLYFELTTMNKDGEKQVYQLQMSVEEVM